MMKQLFTIFLSLLILIACNPSKKEIHHRVVENFNSGWKFYHGDAPQAEMANFDDASWPEVEVPHDWSIEIGYQQEGTASSTGFVPGGIGWYRKSFQLSAEDQGKEICLLFDGVYNNSTVWINGHKLGFRPSGFSSFAYNLTPYVHFGDKDNVIAVKVDHSAYADSRWYTGSGIYRKVQLIKKSPVNIALWGVRIITPEVSKDAATISVTTIIHHANGQSADELKLKYTLLDPAGAEVATTSMEVAAEDLKGKATLRVEKPQLWSLDQPNLYGMQVSLLQNDKLLDQTTETFGIRFFAFDPNNGFSLNGQQMKIKGVNLHHDAGAVGAAVPKGLWKYRIQKLKSIGVNAVRLAHNQHAVELLEVCDELGMLVMDEAFDEWSRPKGKSLVYLGDNAAPAEASKGYPAVFNQWAERDLKDLIRRDFNHPSVILWSVGNEIEWTFPDYSKTYAAVNGAGKKYYKHTPIYDSTAIRKSFDQITGGKDSLSLIARQLVDWVKEEDTTRPVTAGCVQPSIDLASGYGHSLDVVGFNYRAVEYDAAHQAYPNLKIIGSENWGAYSEWKNCLDRDFVSGIFVWTGFAYLGEGGPWPRKGLEISLFDYAGFQTPRGHFFECLWMDKPKVYLVTAPEEESEFSYSQTEGWSFDMNYYKPPFWPELRLWEWYKVYNKWNYNPETPVVVQAYTNCEEAELFLNGVSLGRQKRDAFAEDNIIKWLVPYRAGELKVIGYDGDRKAAEYQLITPGKPSQILLKSDPEIRKTATGDVMVVDAQLLDEKGNPVADDERHVTFQVSGPATNLGVDNGWEQNVQPHKSYQLTTHLGRAVILLQTTGKGPVKVSASGEDLTSNTLEFVVE